MTTDIDTTANVVSIRLRPEIAEAIDREAGRIGITSAEWIARILAGVLQFSGKLKSQEYKQP